MRVSRVLVILSGIERLPDPEAPQSAYPCELIRTSRIVLREALDREISRRETRRRKSEAAKALWRNPEYKERMRAAARDSWKRPETRAKRVAELRSRKVSDDRRKMASENMKRIWAEWRAARNKNT